MDSNLTVSGPELVLSLDSKWFPLWTGLEMVASHKQHSRSGHGKDQSFYIRHEGKTANGMRRTLFGEFSQLTL
jgi:hypothetical protein